jgi:4-alpha-glucanotransferase
MNYPGNPSGNWTWRMAEDALSDVLAGRISDLNYLYSRKMAEAEPENLASSQKAENYFTEV